MSLNKYMHPRNPYRHQKPNFQLLASKYPEFSSHVVTDTAGKVFLDFKNPEDLRVLTKTLMKEDFGLDVELPQDRLVPTIPLRLNYLLWVEDIIGRKKSGVRGIDIGTGSSCVYPLLGNKMNKWSFLATDIDAQNVFYARKNVEKNNLTSAITVKKVTEDALITGALLDEDSDVTYEFCICNPPFFADHMEAQAVSTSRSVERSEPCSVSTASPKESIAPGGEVMFVKQLIADSAALRTRVRVYTSMLGKKTSIPPLKEELRKLQVPKYATTEFCQGKTMRWGIAWSFDESVVFPKSAFQSSKNEKPPLSYIVPFAAGGSIYDVPHLTQHIKTLLNELQIQHREKKCHKGFSSLAVVAYDNTWSNQRRKRRLKLREGADNSTGITADTSVVTDKLGEELKESGKGDNSGLEVKGDDSGLEVKGDNSGLEVKGDNSGLEVKGDDSGLEVKGDDSGLEVKGDESGLEVKGGDDSGSLNVSGDMDVDGSVDDSEQRKRKAPETLLEESGESKRIKVMEDTEVVVKNIETELVDNSKSQDCDINRSGPDGSMKSKPDDTSNVADVKKPTPSDLAKSGKKRYILKCDVNLKKPAGHPEVTLEMVWRDGDRRELMHQVMQYLKNKLKPPC
ncbi:RNA N6-adenosine-methyltransferase mettl16-like [Haliotis rufescens]|uniref:RNA N6-adenosine-methyltransferase mettl16-like n=1 Tax=Haliotis rufescens TaxID=6454 RepID=UPI00201E80EF|nr:RNA N6-adenosine-methyltransferase mettl16-like [Haliotis rufescens]XP_046351659.2 RNA N6-adenosine-methyltransferase mettl16-like [Haliotis rufescens]